MPRITGGIPPHDPPARMNTSSIRAEHEAALEQMHQDAAAKRAARLAAEAEQRDRRRELIASALGDLFADLDARSALDLDPDDQADTENPTNEENS